MFRMFWDLKTSRCNIWERRVLVSYNIVLYTRPTLECIFNNNDQRIYDYSCQERRLFFRFATIWIYLLGFLAKVNLWRI